MTLQDESGVNLTMQSPEKMQDDVRECVLTFPVSHDAAVLLSDSIRR